VESMNLIALNVQPSLPIQALAAEIVTKVRLKFAKIYFFQP
jgi:hypothetical protein